jgi:hypothetical protein
MTALRNSTKAGAILSLSVSLGLCVLFTSSPARADQINGTWCAPGGGKSIRVEDASVISPGGKTVTANVVRHHVDFVIPPGEPDAGATFYADQLSDEQIRVTIKSKAGVTAPEIWTPCKPVS